MFLSLFASECLHVRLNTQVAKSDHGLYNDGNESKRRTSMRRTSMIGRVARSIHDSEPGQVEAGMT
ncbi:hypothetical protein [Paenibacillus sp. PCH8]|uniref:hypothetical protein n=1 Tax=Paenibacillus sp. PCH8 TaxID=2066524 RepID=UPI0011AFF0E1|nr:hypothetical protein [Paenibacillus sp. PCH8]